MPTMRWKALIVLLTIALGLIVPPSLALNNALGGQTTIGTLDVCSSATPALSANGEMPCVNECPCKQVPLSAVGQAGPVRHIFTQTLIPAQNDRPPKA